MSRSLTPKHIVGFVVFTITCLGSVWLFKEQVTGGLETSPPPPRTVSVSSKFTLIGNAPTRSGPLSNLQFINEKQGWILQENDLWQTQDGGKTWQLVYQIKDSVSRYLNEFQFSNANDGWAKFSFYLHKTADGGRSWTRMVTPMDDGYGSLWTFHLDSSGKTGWIAGGIFHPLKLGGPCMNNATSASPDGYACLKGAVFRTDDGGLSWQPQNIPQFVGRFMSITLTDADHVWVAGDAGVFHTTNGGRTWSSDKFGRECEDYYELPDREPVSTAFVDNKNGWLFLSSGQIAKSTDGGKTWCDLFEPESLWTYDPNYVGPSQQFRDIHFKDANYGVGLGYDRLVYETLDGGATWRREGTDVRFQAIEFSDNVTGWALSKDQELYRVQLDEVTGDLVAPREEPRQLIDIFTDADSISYQGYVVKRRNEKIDDGSTSGLEVSYAVLMKNDRRLLKFAGVYFDLGNDTQFGLFGMLGPDSEQIIVSQTVPRGGRHWVVSVSPDVRVLFDSWDYGVGREEFYVIDIDKDGVYEIVLPVTAFYSMQDKMYIGEIPLPEIIFKYDAKARRYLPANHRYLDYTLHGIERDIRKLRDDDANYLSRRLNILLRYVYARKAKEGWAFFEQEYQRSDRREIIARIRSVLKKNELYNYLY